MSHKQEVEIQSMMELLRDCGGNYGQIHDMLKEKRLAWFEDHKNRLRLSGTIPEQAYQLAMLEYLGLDPEEVPIIHSDETKITWRSFNFCPVIDACERLGLDTRVVCKEGFEESIQDLIRHLNPDLRFTRNYKDGIRPYAEYCEETIELVREVGT